MPNHSIMLDALLGYAVCLRDDIDPALTEDELVEIDIPLVRRNGVYQCTQAHFDIERYEGKHITGRPVIEEAKLYGAPTRKSVAIAAGLDKGTRTPLPILYPRDGVVTWWTLGAPEETATLLHRYVTHLGKRRAVGHGRIERWEVVEIEPWGDGFPVSKDGQPLRPLPLDHPGIDESAEHGYRVLHPPYWRKHLEQECFVPPPQEWC